MIHDSQSIELFRGIVKNLLSIDQVVIERLSKTLVRLIEH